MFKFGGHCTRTAFVSTNSVSQGEQVGVLWSELFQRYNIKIHFAHRTFAWKNEARENAAVHVVIIGFSTFDVLNKKLFEYDDIRNEPLEATVKNINPYLVAGNDNFVTKRRTPICDVPEIVFGSMPNDGGNFLFSDEEKKAFVAEEPAADKFFRRFMGGQEFISGEMRWCLWLKDASPSEIKGLPQVLKRIEAVRKSRLESNRPTTKKLAETPTLFGEVRQPATDYLVFPEVSSERRKYVPVGFMSKDVITSNKNYTIANAGRYHFGVLQSKMHMVWLRNVGGRMKSDISYSAGIVYNNFPWPEDPSPKVIAAVESAAQAVLDARALFPTASLADLYDPLSMPPALDRAVDKAYGASFTTEAKRTEFLFALYEEYTAGLFTKEKKQKGKRVAAVIPSQALGKAPGSAEGGI